MNRRTLLKSASTAAVIPALLDVAVNAQTLSPDTVYELRIYVMNPGKLPLILTRFRSAETKIFARLGMHNVAFFTPTGEATNTESAETLVYLMRHNSREAARASWAAFSKDPEWIALKASSEKDGPFVAKHESTFLKLTDFSPTL
jgi:hypothetical protein